RSEKLLPESAGRRRLRAAGRHRGSRKRSRRRRAGGGSLREELARYGDEAFALELGFGIHAPHRGVVDPAFETLECGPGPRQALRQVGAEEQHRVVAREIIAIVGEYGETVLVDLGVGRIDVDRIDL